MRILLLFLVFSSALLAQDSLYYKKERDTLYREDQFYVGISYNILQNKPSGLSPNSFSSGITFGFLRDMPINANRTFAIAPGLGISYQTYHQNLLIQEINGQTNYELIPNDISFDKNNFSQLLIELPIEFRWRTSTPDSHRFFRLYTGLKLGYLLNSTSRFVSNGESTKIRNNSDFNSFQYGVYLATGYNTWNFYAYYGLNPLFKNSVQLNEKTLELSVLHFGLQFYIL